MKTIHVIPVLLTAVLPAALGAPPRTSVIRDAPTNEQLAKTYRQAQQADPMRNLKPAKGPDPSLVNQPEDLIKRSDILCFGGNATLVPKRAILKVPKHVADRLKFQPGSKLLSWLDFYTLNRGWITTVEVSLEQAEGKKAIAEEISERIGKNSNLVVATFKGGPISVLPLKVSEETANAK